MKLSEKCARNTILGIISWLSVCLLVIGLFPAISDSFQHFWTIAGLFGLVSAVGLSEALKIESRDQEELLSSYASEARTDALTELGNRRAFDAELAHWQRHWKSGREFSLLLIDVDHFKSFNDEHGHQAGDTMLREVADLLRQQVAGIGTATRYGGEEFALFLPWCDLAEAQTHAEAIRKGVDGLTVSFRGQNLHVTLSIGIAEAERKDDAAQLVVRADDQLYAAKEAGRNCIRPLLETPVGMDSLALLVLAQSS